MASEFEKNPGKKNRRRTATAFEKKVWDAAALIPCGCVATYYCIAKAIGNPKAARAVGNALNKSPGMPKVPCHRVIKSNGQIGGFAHGTRRKIQMLKKEGVKIQNGKIISLKNILHIF